MQHPNAGIAPGEIHAERGVITHQGEHNDHGVEHRGLLHEMRVVVRDPVGLGGHLLLAIATTGAGRHLA